jgi:hypothetical protein
VRRGGFGRSQPRSLEIASCAGPVRSGRPAFVDGGGDGFMNGFRAGLIVGAAGKLGVCGAPWSWFETSFGSSL